MKNSNDILPVEIPNCRNSCTLSVEVLFEFLVTDSLLFSFAFCWHIFNSIRIKAWLNDQPSCLWDILYLCYPPTALNYPPAETEVAILLVWQKITKTFHCQDCVFIVLSLGLLRHFSSATPTLFLTHGHLIFFSSPPSPCRPSSPPSSRRLLRAFLSVRYCVMSSGKTHRYNRYSGGAAAAAAAIAAAIPSSPSTPPAESGVGDTLVNIESCFATSDFEANIWYFKNSIAQHQQKLGTKWHLIQTI